MDAIVKNHKAVYAWSGDRPGVAEAFLELAGEYSTIDTTASDASTQVQTMAEGVYLLTGLPDWIDMASGRDVREFDPTTWRLWPNSKLITLGYKILEKWQKLVGEEILIKTENEQMRDGVIDTPKGIKIVEDATSADGLSKASMSLAEMVAAKQITQAEADAQTAAAVQEKVQDILSSTYDKKIAQINRDIRLAETAGATTDELSAKRATWDSYAVAVLAIKSQEGYPYTVTWPTAPQD